MRVLMLGAGATGGYFGGRMAAAGSDVTFLVRQKRAAQLQDGLRIESPRGNATIPVVTLFAGEESSSFDVIILSCKSYGLADTLESIARHVRPGMPILPLLNGYGHIDEIEHRFPAAVVWGGTAGIVATLAEDGTVRQMHPNQFISAGARRGQSVETALLKALVAEMCRAEIVATVSDDIERATWDKWCFLATLAASRCLMRAPISAILATDHGETLIASLYKECNRTAAAEGIAPGPPSMQEYRGLLFDRDGNFTASMLRDMENGRPTEAGHVIGDLIGSARRHGVETPNLAVAYSHLQICEAQRARRQ